MKPDPSDQDLLRDWRAGDNGAGSLLVKRHYRALHRFFRTKAHAHCDDLIQETFLACTQTKESFRGESSFRTYLFGLARYQLLTYYRKRRRVCQIDVATCTLRDLGTTPSGVLVRGQEHQLLRLALTHVTIDQQIALELSYWENLPAPEIARVLEVPEDTVYSRLRRAKARLREALHMLESNAEARARAFAQLAEVGGD